MSRRFLGPALAAGVLGLAAAGALAGGTPAWKPFLPAAAAKELTDRAIKTAEDLGKNASDKALQRMQAEALLIAGFTLAGPDADAAEQKRRRADALEVAREAGLKDRNADTLAARLRTPKASDLPAAPKTTQWRASVDDISVLMVLFRPRKKGGEGLPAGLQYNPKLKNQDNTEDLIGALASKKLTDANAAKVSKELELFGYRSALIGAITHDYAPDKGAKGTPAQWHEQADVMRDSSVALAQAAAKKDTAGVQDAAKKLEGSCTKCHQLFRQ